MNYAVWSYDRSGRKKWVATFNNNVAAVRFARAENLIYGSHLDFRVIPVRSK